jgi:prepilin-type N-terminal cleavage/methylation domain-containing protein
MKAPKGFTLIEVVVACTLVLLLSTMATTTMYNFLQATINLKGQYNNIQNIMALHSALANAKMNYATDLAFVLAAAQAVPPTDPTYNAAQTKIQSIQADTHTWNLWAQQNDSGSLINQLINPDQSLGIPLAHLNPQPSNSYLPASRNVQVTTYDSQGHATTTVVVVQIKDITSLLQAYQLTDNGMPSGNPVATISVGPILDVASGFRPMLPVIDWKSGTPQEIQF